MTKLNNYKKLIDNDKIYYKHILSDENTSPSIDLLIEINKQNHKPQLKINPNSYFENNDNFTLFWKAKNLDEMGELHYRKTNAVGDYLFAADIVKFLTLEFDLTFCGQKLFTDNSGKVFIDVFEDYHKLTQMQLMTE